MELTIANCPDNTLALTNCLYVSPRVLATLGSDTEVNLKVGKYIFTTRASQKMQDMEIGFSGPQRRLGFSAGDKITVSVHPAEDVEPLACANLEVDYVVAAKHKAGQTFDGKELVAKILERFGKQYVTIGQLIVTEINGFNLLLKVGVLEAADLKSDAGGAACGQGVLGVGTQIVLSKAANSPIVLTNLETQKKSVFKADFSFADMGIGGLDKEFQDIFRRAFASRIFPPAVVKKLGIQHVKGMLLYGPPGTGKTLIARQIGKMLNGKEPKIVNGPEILSKFVGESEKNIRELFADADAEMAERGDDSDLHIIIFDEIDSVCRQRGSSNSGTNVGDTVVNQLLSKIDGVNSLNNILLIGMTNRKDMIDEALLRPGRLEVHVQISLPDEAGRAQILKIHTGKLREAKALHEDVSLPVLATETKNFSGAEIEGLVKSATSFAFARQTNPNNIMKVNADDILVKREDFDRGLQEVRPAFGASTDDLEASAKRLLELGGKMQTLCKSGAEHIEQMKQSERTPLLSILLEGAVGAGKTAIAAKLALGSDIPFIKLISPNAMVGMGEAQKVQYIARVFDDACKSPLSLVVLDDIERLLEYVRIGPRFSNAILQTILTCVKKPPNKSKLVILGTTSSAETLEQLELREAFNVQFEVPSLGADEALQVLTLCGVANMTAVEPTLRTVTAQIPIKKLMLVIEMSLREDGITIDPARFATTLQDVGLL